MIAAAPRLRDIAWIAFFGAVCALWAILFLMVRSDPASGAAGMGAEFWASLCLDAADAGFGTLWGMWAAMAAAMMLPAFAPALATWGDLVRGGIARARDGLWLVAGYLGVWLAVAAGAAALQGALGRAGALLPDGRLVSGVAAGAVMLGAGLWQFSALKDACLAKCRHPVAHFIAIWRPGAGGAAGMGARMGLTCLGCCWALMALAFVGGTMNLVWMGAATVFVVAEKLPRSGVWLTRPAGWALMLGGGATMILGAAPG